jgi:hypothetical protein
MDHSNNTTTVEQFNVSPPSEIVTNTGSPIHESQVELILDPEQDYVMEITSRRESVWSQQSRQQSPDEWVDVKDSSVTYHFNEGEIIAQHPSSPKSR